MKKIVVLLLASGFLFTACTKSKGTVSMTYNKGTAIYADLAAVRATPLLGPARSISDAGKIFIGDQVLLIGEEGLGIHVFDNTNPNSPSNTVFINLPYTKEFFVRDQIIYAESQYDLVKIDISNLHNPVLISRLENAMHDPIYNNKGEVLMGFSYQVTTESYDVNSPEAEELKKSHELYYDYNNNMIPLSMVPSAFIGSSETKGTMNKIVVEDKHIYVLGRNILHSFSDEPTGMQKLNSEMLGQDLETLYAEGDKLFVGTASSMLVYSIADPGKPDRVSAYQHPTSCDPVYPNGKVAYLTLRTADYTGCSGDVNSLEILDISDIAKPKFIQSMEMNSPYGMTLTDNYLFVGEGSNGLRVFKADDPTKLVELKVFKDIKAYDIIKHPTITNRILTTGEHGLAQYQMDYSTMEMTYLSSIAY